MPLVGETEESCLGLRCLWSERRRNRAWHQSVGNEDRKRLTEARVVSVCVWSQFPVDGLHNYGEQEMVLCVWVFICIVFSRVQNWHDMFVFSSPAGTGVCVYVGVGGWVG